MVRDRVWLKVYRQTALLAQENRCKYCYEPLTVRTVTADHYIPKAKGGNNRRQNIVAACKPCNRLKGVKSEEEFLSWIQNSNQYSALMVNFRRTLWQRTHTACSRILQSVGVTN